MAYQARGRDPLLDSNMQAMIEKRGKEMIGVALIVLGVLAAMIVGSYTPSDPSWLSATDAPVQNYLGQFGASIAAPLFMIVGKASWVIPLTLLAWGVRFLLHQGADRALSRLIFLPIAVVVCAVYASSLLPGATWTHAFGLGGLFGDTVLGAFLTFLPFSASVGLKLVAFLLAIGAVVMVGFVLGVTRSELKEGARFLAIGIVVTYAMAMRLIGKGASGALGAASAMQARKQEQREAARLAEEETAARRMAEEPQMTTAVEADPVLEPIEPMEAVQEAPVVEKEKTGLLARMPSLIKRPEPMPEPELVEPVQTADYSDMPTDDRIKSKISDVIKSRVRHAPNTQAQPRTAAPLTAAQKRRRGPEPLLVDTSQPNQRVEPPMTATLIAEPTAAAAQAAGTLAFSSARMEAAPMTNVVEPVLEAAAPALEPAAPQVAPAPAFLSAQMQTQPPLEQPVPQEPMALMPTHVEPELEPAPVAAPLKVAPAAFDAMPTEQLPSSDLPTAELVEAPSFESAPQVDEAAIAAFQSAPEPAIPHETPKSVVQHTQRKPVKPSSRAKAEAQPTLKFADSAAAFELPPLNLLESPIEIQRHHLSDEALEENARMLESVLDDYGVKGEIVSVRPGPVVTMYELEPAPGLKASRVIGLSDDIARSMSALSARVSTVPGRSVIGIELPNENREKVVLREILASRDFGDGQQKLPLALGKDIGGDPIVANLAKMPHLLIAGTTGSGKSVAINTMILSLLYKLTPEECRLIMIDPKMLELSVYDGIPHLLSPVVTDPKKAVVALKWTVGEMEERYRKMSKMGVRNIDGYNSRVADALSKNEMFSRTVQTGFDDETGEPIFETEETQPEKMPYIVVIVDEMADLMMVAGKEIEACIQRLAQMARASGIHLIMATQRPSVDVITGTIKANFPTRISFQVTSKIDSRTILGEMGAEQLLGMGDMLYMAGGAKITRCHGPFVSDEEVEEIVNHLKAYGPPNYMSGVVEGPSEEAASSIDTVLGLGGNTDGEDALYDTAVQIVIKDRKCSTSYIQRKLAIGYNKAARLVEQMEDEGLVSPANHVGKRDILVPEQQ
ncbi:DNA translocase FtsK 4TM domain-containing protein [Planktotalea sp.]|uniref:DNA translocase FtsK n=1 Tax=Planktotalea sp. TaxID=2029877 RepID=UPI00329877B3